MMVCTKKISWVIIILAVSFFGCSNPAGDTTAAADPTSPTGPTPPTWEKLYVKFEVSGVVARRGNRDGNNMISHKYDKNGYDGRWDSSISFNSKIDHSWSDAYQDPPEDPYIYDTKEVIIYRRYPQSLRVGVKGFSGGDGFTRDRRDYLITKIYVKKTDTDDYKLYTQKRGDRPNHRNANLEVVLTADLINYR